jgi:hypothetical protein
MNWRHLEPPDPLDALMNGRTRPMPGPQDDPNRVVTHCETCGVQQTDQEPW